MCMLCGFAVPACQQPSETACTFLFLRVTGSRWRGTEISVVIQGNYSTHGHYILKYLKQVQQGRGALDWSSRDGCDGPSCSCTTDVFRPGSTHHSSFQMAIITPYAEITYTYTVRCSVTAP